MARLPKSIIKKHGITKKAWRIFKGKQNKKKNTRKASPKTGGKKRMGKRGFLNQQSLFKFVRVGALVAPAAAWFMTNNPMDFKIKAALKEYTGYDMNTREFSWKYLARGWTPFLMACLVTYGIPKINSIIRKL